MIWLKVILILVACTISAILYRAGGMSKDDTAEPKWIPKWLRQSWIRDWLCPPVLLLLTALLFGFYKNYWYLYLICWGLSGGALSTYWDWLFGYDCFWFSGLICGIAAVPLCWVMPWWIVLIRLVVCAIGWGLWSGLVDNDVREEMGRGFLFII